MSKGSGCVSVRLIHPPLNYKKGDIDMGMLKNGVWAAFDLVSLPIVTAAAVITGEEDKISPYVDDLKNRVEDINKEIRARKEYEQRKEN